MASQDAIAKTFALLRMAYPDHAGKHLRTKAVMTQMMDVYSAVLQDVGDAVLLAAARDHVAGSKWWPKVAELRDRAFDIMSNALELPTAYEAWALVRRLLRAGRGGPYEMWRNGKRMKWRAQLPIIEKSVEGVGGWKVLANSDNVVADRSQFYRCYETLVARERARLAMLPEVRLLIKQIAGGGGMKQIEEGQR